MDYIPAQIFIINAMVFLIVVFTDILILRDYLIDHIITKTIIQLWAYTTAISAPSICIYYVLKL